MGKFFLRLTSIVVALSLPIATIEVAHSETRDTSFNIDLSQPNETYSPTPTPEQIQDIHDYLGPEAVAEIRRAQIEASNGERAAPVIAGAAIAAVAWCASGALSSIPTSVLADIVNRGDGGGDYVRNAIYGCAAGNIGSWAWKIIPNSIKQKVLNAVVRFYLDHIRK
ncbi:MAG: hypothetical protein Q3976_07875 [Corynebacterium sp.]|nr:hypothetical protein [Corynebacterium sp.]